MKEKELICRTGVASGAFLFLVFFVAVFSKVFLGEKSIQATTIAVGLIPFVIYLVLAGKLTEFRGPGGIGVTLKEEVEKTVTLSYGDEVIQYEPEVVEEKMSVNELRNNLRKKRPTVLTFEIGKTNYYKEWAIDEYIKDFSKNPEFKTIVFKGYDGRFQGFMNLEDFKGLLERSGNDHMNIVRLLENGSILNQSRVNTLFITREDTNKAALKKMEENRKREAAVVDERQVFIGTIRQDDIMKKVLVTIMQSV